MGRCNALLVVGVDLAKGNLAGLGEFGRQRFKSWRDHLAGTTPVGIDYTCSVVSNVVASEPNAQIGRAPRCCLQSATTIVDEPRMRVHSLWESMFTAIISVDSGSRK